MFCPDVKCLIENDAGINLTCYNATKQNVVVIVNRTVILRLGLGLKLLFQEAIRLWYI